MEKLLRRLDEIILEKREWTKKGHVAEYIPALKKANPDILGIALHDLEGKMYVAGDYDYNFTIQSISKIITLAIALMDVGEEVVFGKVGKEPTGDPFNSIVKLETLRPSRPLNPMINAGAIVVSSLIKGKNIDDRFKRITDLIKKLTGKEKIKIDENVYFSEKETGHRNRALAYFMKNEKVLEGDVEEVLDLYFRQCAILLNVMDLAKIGVVLAKNGRSLDGEVIIPPKVARIVKTFMVTCGMYNSSGEFAIDVGIPAKSGVGGGILAAVPGRWGIGVVGPALDEKGNSIAGIEVLKTLSEELQLSLFTAD